MVTYEIAEELRRKGARGIRAMVSRVLYLWIGAIGCRCRWNQVWRCLGR